MRKQAFGDLVDHKAACVVVGKSGINGNGVAVHMNVENNFFVGGFSVVCAAASRERGQHGDDQTYAEDLFHG